MKTKIAVIGAGISGITTGVMLQEFGFQVTTYSKELPLTKQKNSFFASQFPSASIIPHSVYHPNLVEIFKESQLIFSSLFESELDGISKHEHFELFGFPKNTPAYVSQISNYIEYSDLDWSPEHPKIPIVSGWKFDSYFADWTVYFPNLVQKYFDNGGIIINDEINLNTFDNINEEIIVNCTGIGSHSLKEENKEPLILLGHLLKIENTPKLLSPQGNTVSYNFSPGVDIYSNSNKTPLDVYIYPRRKDWILGGSRFKGTLDTDGNWVSKDPLSLTFPDQIESINAEIIKNSFGIDIESFKNKEQQQSFRYVRNTKNGLRIEKSDRPKGLIIHNYGHGGAGVTLSWGSAFRVLNMVSEYKKGRVNTINQVVGVLRKLTNS